MEDDLFEGQGRIAVRMASKTWTTAPGRPITLSLVLRNQGPADDFFELSVRGIPTEWVSMPSPVVRLASGEQRETSLVIQPPPVPHSRAGRYPLVIRVGSQDAPDQMAEVEGSLTVAALEVQGRIGVLLASNDFSVVPGGSTTIPVSLVNQGLDPDTFQLGVDGIPTSWVSTPSALTPLSPGQQKEVSLTIQPPRAVQSRAGRHPFKIRVSSQATPYQAAEADCTLTVATFGQFSAVLNPPRVEAGQPGRMTVENQGNIQQTFTLAWQSLNDELAFEPGPAQELRVAAGQVAMAEYRATPRRRPFFGGEVALPFTARVQSAEKETQNLQGEVVSRALVPTWVLPVMLGLLLVIACAAIFLLFSGGPREARPTEPAAPGATAPAPTEGVPPEAPTEAPPAEVPTEEPPEQPTEEPPVGPSEEPPVEPTDDSGGATGPELPCLPAAFSIALLPLLMTRVVGAGRTRGEG